jgi:hypothetical protein
MSNDIFESVSQRVCGEETPQNRRIRQVADELRRRCELYEAQFRDGEKDVNNLDVFLLCQTQIMMILVVKVLVGTVGMNLTDKNLEMSTCSS